MPFAPLDHWLAPAPAPEKVAWLGKWDYAHRGLHGQHRVENSASAFQAAINAGLGIECDIQRSRDDCPMVFHDWDLSRLIGRDDRTEQVTAAEMRELKYRGSDEGPISLDSLLRTIGGKVPVLIEVKSRPGYDVEWSCTGVHECLAGYDGLHAVMSFDPRVSRWFAVNSPVTVRGLVVTEEGAPGWRGKSRRRASFVHARPDFLACDIRDLPSAFAASQRARGLPVVSWTVRSAELRARAALHADAPIAEGDGVA